MSKNKHDVPQSDDPQLNRLAQALQANPLPAPPLPAANKQQLRQRLLARATPPGWHRFRAALGTAVALIVLVSAVAFFWLAQAGQDTAVGPLSAARATSTPETEGAPSGAPDAPANIPEFTAHETAKILQIEEVDPPAGTLITGPQPITITFSLQLNGVSTATIRAKVVEMMGSGFRGIAENDVVVTPEDGRFTMVIPFNTDHLLEPANLGLFIEGRSDPNPRTPPDLFVELRSDYWRYEPGNSDQDAEDAPNDDAPGSISEETPSPYPHATSNLLIEQVYPPAGTLLTGPQPITITFSLQLDGVPTATIRAKVVEMMGSSFRGVAGNDVVVTPEDGRFTLIIPFTPNELNGPANLGLYVEGRTDPNFRTLANLFINMPGEVLWRYEPENGDQDAGTP